MADTAEKANCWFMVSFIYECLDETFHGSTIARFLYLRKGSEEIRREIRTTSRLIVSFPFEEVVCIISSDSVFERLDGLTCIRLKAV